MEGLVAELVKDYIDSPGDMLNDARWEIYETFSSLPKAEMYSIVLCSFFDQFISDGNTTEQQRADYIRTHLGVILSKYMSITGLNDAF
jgi:hypothetical protein